MADILPHEYIHTLQSSTSLSNNELLRNDFGDNIKYTGLSKLSKQKKAWRKAVRASVDAVAKVTTGLSTVSGYYAKSVEMQARIHEILAYGYTQWEKLPTNKIELWAALVNCGLNAPKPVLDMLHNTEIGQEKLAEFKTSSRIKNVTSHITSTFNDIHRYAGEEDVQVMLWERKYPTLYGELIELYGDKLGRERMDMGINPREAIEVMKVLNSHKGNMKAEVAIELSNQIRPEQSAAFLNGIIANYPLGAENFENAMLISQKLLNREDVKSYLFKEEQQIISSSSLYEEPPLDLAILFQHTTMQKILLDAGANPHQKYSVINSMGEVIFSGSIHEATI